VDADLAVALMKARGIEPEPAAVDDWPVIDAAAYHGLAGDVVRTIEPHSEADPVALLLQTLAAAGNVIGHSPYYQVESDRHRTNLFCCLVGATAKARKGTSLGRVRNVVKVADELWSANRINGGLSSGEGLINEVRDPIEKLNSRTDELEIIDLGVKDKRLLVIEPEFAAVLAVAERHGNTLTEQMRRAWDGVKLATMTKNSPLSATDHHISIIGHITEVELKARLTRTDGANGFANRFLFALVRRSKELPFGGQLTEGAIMRLGERLKGAIEKAKNVGQVGMTETAQEKWAAVYSALSAGKPGLLGAVTARAEAQTVRLALIYALLDGAEYIDLPHLMAALGVWEYAEASAAHIFGDALGDPVADEIIVALRKAGSLGMTRTVIRDLFGRNKSSDRIGAALVLLQRIGSARVQSTTTGGRPSETWFAAY
jgi:transposase